MSGKPASPPLTANEAAQLQNAVLMSHEAAKAPLAEAFSSVEKKRLVAHSNGKITAEVCDDPLTGRLAHRNLRPTKFHSKQWQMNSTPADVLRGLVELEPSLYLKLSDDDVWGVAAKAAQEGRLTGNDLLVLSRCVFSLLAIRCGLAAPTMYNTV